MNRQSKARGTKPFSWTLVLIPLVLTVGTTHAQVPPPSTNVSVVATGLDNPRGLKFGPDGMLYVAEGGRGGATSTVGTCDQVIPPVGPYTSGPTARISRIDAHGVRTTVVDGLPSSQTSPALGGLVSGVADVAFIGDALYALLAGAGCSHGVADVPNGVIRVNRANGTWKLVADLSRFVMTHPVANPEPDDFEPDGTWYSMIVVRDDLYVVEPNHGEMDVVSPHGAIRRVIDVSATQGHVVPTAVAFHGNFYIGNLNTFPITPGTSNIYKVTPSGRIKVVVPEMTSVVGVAFDHEARLYVLETSDASGFPTPGAGKVLRVSPSGEVETIASGLTFPTAMTFGSDGSLYVSHFGFGFPPGAGQVVRVQLP
jgi:hypothetical protein